MKKIFSMMLIIMVMFALVACDEVAGGDPYDIPELDEAQKVELTDAELYTIISGMDMDAALASNLSYQLKGAVDFVGEFVSQSQGSMSTSNSSTDIDISASVDQEAHIYLPEAAEDFVAYAAINSFNLDMSFNSAYASTYPDYPEWDYSESSEEALEVSVQNSYFLIKDLYAYANIDASVTEAGATMTYELSEKYNEPLPEEDYAEMLEELSVDVSSELPALADIQAMLDENEELGNLADLINVYQDGESYTLQFYVDGTTFKASFADMLSLNEAPSYIASGLNSALDLALQSFEFDVRFVVTAGALSKFSVALDVDIQDFSWNLIESEGDYSMTQSVDFTLTIADFSFVIATGQDLPELPSDETLAEFTAVDEFSFASQFETEEPEYNY